MSQWERVSPGSKRKLESSNTERLSHVLPHSQEINSSQSSEGSSSRPCSLGDRSLNNDRQSGYTYQSRHILGGDPSVLGGPEQAKSSSFTLPSLSVTKSTIFTLPPISPTPPRTSRPDALTYDQDINNLPGQMLHSENANLITAYSSAQIRIAELDEELRLSRMDFMKLVKERQRLEAKVDLLEAEVDELQKNMDIAQQHTAAKDTQYSQILELSTKLQTQEVAETQQRRTERERWLQDKQHMERSIIMLNSEITQLRTSSRRSMTPEPPRMDGSGSPKAGPTTTDQTEFGAPWKTPKHEIRYSRNALINIRKQHGELMKLIEKSESIGRDMQAYMDSMELHYRSPSEHGD